MAKDEEKKAEHLAHHGYLPLIRCKAKMPPVKPPKKDDET